MKNAGRKNISKYEAVFYFIFSLVYFLFHQQLEFHKVTRYYIFPCIAKVHGRRQFFPEELAVWIDKTRKGWWWQLKDEN